MAPRRPLGVISGNKRPRKELTASERGYIRGAKAYNAPTPDLCKQFDCDEGTIRYTVEMAPQRQADKTLERTGRPCTWSERDVRQLVRILRQNPFWKWSQVQAKMTTPYSEHILRSMLQTTHLGHWRAKKRPRLTSQIAKQRLKWAQTRQDWSADDWRGVVFSDECSVERNAGASGVWVFRYPWEKFKTDFCVPSAKGKDLTVMIYAAFAGTGEGVVVVMRRDPASKKGGYSARSYVQALEEAIPTVYKKGMYYLQDNAPIHKADLTLEWLKKHDVVLEPIPPNSPDINCIEHVWPSLKGILIREYKDDLGTRMSGEARDHFEDVVIKGFQEVLPGLIDGLMESMPRRMQAIIREGGWHTEY